MNIEDLEKRKLELILSKEITNEENLCENCKSKYLENKESKIKQFIKYVLPIYIIYILFLVFSWISFNNSNKESCEGLKCLSNSFEFIIYIFLGIVVSSIMSFVLSVKNIKKNFNNYNRGNRSKIIINVLNSILIYHLLVIIIYNVIINFIKVDYSVMFFAIYYLLSPFIIIILKYINNDNFVSSKDINRIIFPLFIIFSILFYPSLGYISHNALAFLMPCSIIGLNNASTNINKVLKKDIILLVVNLLLIIIVVMILYMK